MENGSKPVYTQKPSVPTELDKVVKEPPADRFRFMEEAIEYSKEIEKRMADNKS